MVDIIASLFAAVGLDINTPVTLANIFPYLLRVSFAALLVGTILKFIGNFSARFMGGKL